MGPLLKPFVLFFFSRLASDIVVPLYSDRSGPSLRLAMYPFVTGVAETKNTEYDNDAFQSILMFSYSL